MSKYELPATQNNESPIHNEIMKKVTALSAKDFEYWLKSAPMAEWAKKWLNSLKDQFGNLFYEMIAEGLGKKLTVPTWMAPDSMDAIWLRQYLSKTDMIRQWFEKGFLQDDPLWLFKLLHFESVRVARSFLLTGNISDYAYDPVKGYRPIIRLLVDSFVKEKDCVFTFRLSQGLTMHCREYEKIITFLPTAIKEELNNCGYDPNDTPLLSKVCKLFDILNRWLTGQRLENNQIDSRELKKGIAFIFENVHLIIPSERTDMERNFLVDSLLHWSISPSLFNSNHCLILMAESLEDVSNDLRAQGGKIEQLIIQRPETAESRLKFIIPLLDPGSQMRETRVSRLSQGRRWLQHYDQKKEETYLKRLERLSNDTAGLSFMGIEDLLQKASTGTFEGISRDHVMEMKRERLSQESEGLLEVIDPTITLTDIGGYKILKERLYDVVNAITNANDPLISATIPMGILFLGPPGTGKSIMAEALAGTSDINMAKLGDFRGKYVGESERNLSRIFSLIQALHPVIIFIDEIDQALGKRVDESGTGVDKRIFGKLLEFISNKEHRGKILWIGAANFSSGIDPAMKRPGRFDLILPFTLPELESRKEILKISLKSSISGMKRVFCQMDENDYIELARKTKGFSGAEICAIIGEVLRKIAQKDNIIDKSIEIKREMFDLVLSVYRPPKGSRKDYQRMEIMAIDEVSFEDLIPERYRKMNKSEEQDYE